MISSEDQAQPDIFIRLFNLNLKKIYRDSVIPKLLNEPEIKLQCLWTLFHKFYFPVDRNNSRGSGIMKVAKQIKLLCWDPIIMMLFFNLKIEKLHFYSKKFGITVGETQFHVNLIVLNANSKN